MRSDSTNWHTEQHHHPGWRHTLIVYFIKKRKNTTNNAQFLPPASQLSNSPNLTNLCHRGSHRATMGGQMPDADGKTRSADSSSSYGYPPSAPPQHQHQYGTFGPTSGASGQFPQPAVGFPQPAPPPGMQHYPQPPPASYAVYPPAQQPYSAAAPYYAQGYQVAQGTEGPSRVLRCEFCAASRLIPFIGSINGRRSFVRRVLCGWFPCAH